VLYVSNKFNILRIGTYNNLLVIQWEMSLMHILDPQISARTNLLAVSNQKDVITYFCQGNETLLL
jgi:hypothetical protein